MEDLKPCPFCGGDELHRNQDNINSTDRVVCNKCSANAKLWQWNTRPTNSESGEVETISGADYVAAILAGRNYIDPTKAEGDNAWEALSTPQPQKSLDIVWKDDGYLGKRDTGLRLEINGQPQEEGKKYPDDGCQSGYGTPCYLCGEIIEQYRSFGKGHCVGLFRDDSSGVIKWHHAGCIVDEIERLRGPDTSAKAGEYPWTNEDIRQAYGTKSLKSDWQYPLPAPEGE